MSKRPEGATIAPDAWWSLELESLLVRLRTSATGLTTADAAQRSAAAESTRLKLRPDAQVWRLLWSQVCSPIVLILLGASGVAWFLGDRTDTGIIIAIVAVSGWLGFWQEHRASQAVARLLALVQVAADMLRDGACHALPLDAVVAGDVVRLRAGDTIPGDCRVLESKALFVDEATLTGETYPVEKRVGLASADAALAARSNCLFLGTHVVSGTGMALVAAVGTETEFGRISGRLRLRQPETEFERGIRRFGYLLAEVTVSLVAVIFVVNVLMARPVLDSFLFSLALAVGLTPQLLPAIISINLAHGARRMAERKVVVKRLASIENFGSMTVFCSDKTGTLTEGTIRLHGAVDLDGRASEKVHLYAALNAEFESGFANPIDAAIRASAAHDLSGYAKLDEEPYDFIRKRLSVLVSGPAGHVVITKGALPNVLDVCADAEVSPQVRVDIAAARARILARAQAAGQDGYRVLGVAYRDLGTQATLTRGDESGMTFLGLLLFDDPPKAGVAAAVAHLRALGVQLKMVTGDHVFVAAHLAEHIGLAPERRLTGDALRHMSDEALVATVSGIDVFAEVEPNQKERIILALKKAGHVVGYGGDGINDASALHAADVGVSVDSAVDVAKKAADIVLLEKDLSILAEGVREGRVTFANTIKYVFMATSANFGNMFSMAGASLFLPFLPLLPKQILLTNLLTDIPEMTIATDAVDPELITRPRRWDLAFIRKFMITFGLVSSVFDFVTFGVLLWVLQAGVEEFRTGWFVESVISASIIVLVIRTRRPFYRSRPGRALLWSTGAVVAATVTMPVMPWRDLLGFTSLPPSFLAAIGLIMVGYIGVAEIAKAFFYRRVMS